ncbi:hypothetical protein WN944_015499 [Citrus x changshan-huyou]|uniref:Uncharacterized protein n=1 Tax=Citrus x changshan-huyou TaxID=2935761 RepID=A0AAP0QR54_9ROSI
MSRLNKLVFLNLKGSKSLKSLPSGIFSLEFLTKLDLSGCSKLKRLPEISSGNISWFFLRGTAIEELPSSIERLLRLGITKNGLNREEKIPSFHIFKDCICNWPLLQQEINEPKQWQPWLDSPIIDNCLVVHAATSTIQQNKHSNKCLTGFL